MHVFAKYANVMMYHLEGCASCSWAISFNLNLWPKFLYMRGSSVNPEDKTLRIKNGVSLFHEVCLTKQHRATVLEHAQAVTAFRQWTHDSMCIRKKFFC